MFRAIVEPFKKQIRFSHVVSALPRLGPALARRDRAGFVHQYRVPDGKLCCCVRASVYDYFGHRGGMKS